MKSRQATKSNPKGGKRNPSRAPKAKTTFKLKTGFQIAKDIKDHTKNFLSASGIQGSYHHATSLGGSVPSDIFIEVPFNDVLAQIKNGVPLAEFDDLAGRLGLTKDEFARKIGASIPTLSRRKKTKSPLDPEHSDHLMRFKRLFGKAVDLFDGDETKARSWLNREEPALGYLKPIDVAETEAGAREVENVIGRLEFGEFT